MDAAAFGAADDDGATEMLGEIPGDGQAEPALVGGIFAFLIKLVEGVFDAGC